MITSLKNLFSPFQAPVFFSSVESIVGVDGLK